MMAFAVRMFAIGCMTAPLIIWLMPPWYVQMSMFFTASMLYDAATKAA